MIKHMVRWFSGKTSRRHAGCGGTAVERRYNTHGFGKVVPSLHRSPVSPAVVLTFKQLCSHHIASTAAEIVFQ